MIWASWAGGGAGGFSGRTFGGRPLGRFTGAGMADLAGFRFDDFGETDFFMFFMMEL